MVIHPVNVDILAIQTIAVDVVESEDAQVVVKAIEAVAQGENAVTPLLTVAATDPIETTKAEITLALDAQLAAMMATIVGQVLLAGDS